MNPQDIVFPFVFAHIVVFKGVKPEQLEGLCQHSRVVVYV